MRLLLLVAAGVAAVVVAGSLGLADVSALPGRAAETLRGAGAGEQSARQLSPTEFVRLDHGTSADDVRALVGEPESSHSTEVEGVRLECWYYGIVRASGAFQLCFADGRLTSRHRYDAIAGSTGSDQ